VARVGPHSRVEATMDVEIALFGKTHGAEFALVPPLSYRVVALDVGGEIALFREFLWAVRAAEWFVTTMNPQMRLQIVFFGKRCVANVALISPKVIMSSTDVRIEVVPGTGHVVAAGILANEFSHPLVHGPHVALQIVFLGKLCIAFLAVVHNEGGMGWGIGEKQKRKKKTHTCVGGRFSSKIFQLACLHV
jgi:hypothetical protein